MNAVQPNVTFQFTVYPEAANEIIGHLPAKPGDWKNVKPKKLRHVAALGLLSNFGKDNITQVQNPDTADTATTFQIHSTMPSDQALELVTILGTKTGSETSGMPYREIAITEFRDGSPGFSIVKGGVRENGQTLGGPGLSGLNL